MLWLIHSSTYKSVKDAVVCFLPVVELEINEFEILTPDTMPPLYATHLVSGGRWRYEKRKIQGEKFQPTSLLPQWDSLLSS